MKIVAVLAALCVAVSFSSRLMAAEIPAPEGEENFLDAIYPTGGQRGTSVEVSFFGPTSHRKKGELHGLKGAIDILVDGPPGITVSGVKNVSDTEVTATLAIAKDVPLGRRMVRVLNRRSGLTNFTYFEVGNLPEARDTGKNNDQATAQEIATVPVVVNGRIEQPLDIDCFAFRATKGQPMVAAIQCHGLDGRIRGSKLRAFVDVTLEVLDEQGRVVADAEDTLGLDPAVSFSAPADGRYTARVYLAGYAGYREAVYRLTLGDVAYPTSVFPSGGQLGQSVAVAFDGFGIPQAVRQTVSLPTESPLPQTWLSLTKPLGAHEVPFVLGRLPESVEHEPNGDQQQATPIDWPVTVNGRFDTADDEDWYRVSLPAGKAIRCEVVAQRHLRSPVDTVIELYDAAGTLVQRNDDSTVLEVENIHDFDPFDSLATFKVKQAGDHLICVREQTGTSGPRAVYRLTVTEDLPDFKLHQWPDALPVFGPGTTSGFYVNVDRVGGWNADIELKVEGLPSGWASSVNYSTVTHPMKRVLLTITASATAKVGDCVPFRVVGRSRQGEQSLEHFAQPLTCYMSNDRQVCRYSPIARAVVAEPQGPWLTTTVRELKVQEGSTIEVPVRIHNGAPNEPVTLIANQSSIGFRIALGVQRKVNVVDGLAQMPVPLDKLPPGTHGITIAWAWGSETRQGTPGPCTPLILVHVEKK